MSRFHGFEPGEVRSQTSHPEKVDQGHSIVERITARRGHTFSFTYTIVCQCGKTFTGRTYMTPFYTHMRHLKREGIL